MRSYLYILFLIAFPALVGAQSLNQNISDWLDNAQRLGQRVQQSAKARYASTHFDIVAYEDSIRTFMRTNQWETAKRYLDAEDLQWGYTSVFHFLNGRYYYQVGDIREARRHWISSVRADSLNAEPIEWLVRLEENEKNYSTAIAHVNHLLQFSPYDIVLWRKKIGLYRLSGNEFEANRLLDRLAVIYPENEQVQRDVAYQRDLRIAAARKEGNEREVQETLSKKIADRANKNADTYLDLANSHLRAGELSQAAEVCARGVNDTRGNYGLITKHLGILFDLGNYDEAEQYIDDCIRKYGYTSLYPLRQQLRRDRAEIAYRNEAYTRYQHLYGDEKSAEDLEWLIRISMQRGYWDDAQFYVAEARRNYGDDPEILAKAYLVEQRLGNQRAARHLLEQRFECNPSDLEVRELIAERRVSEAHDFMTDSLYRQAIPLLEQADTLTNDTSYRMLIQRRLAICYALVPDTTVLDSFAEMDNMQRSIHYERLHQTDSAYVYLLRYNPSLNEYHYWKRHGYTLQSKLMRNNLNFEYQYARRTSIDQWSHNAYVNYSHNFGRDVLECSVAYAGRESSSWNDVTNDGRDTVITSGGGSGVQLGLGYAHYFKWGDIQLGATWASRFLPYASARISFTENLPADWTLTERLSWRYINDEQRYHIGALGIMATWARGHFSLAPSIDLFLMKKHVYVNGGFNFRYYPLDGDRSNVFASFGIGNAPELSILDNNLPIRFAHLNTNVSGGGVYQVNGHLSLAGSVTYYVIGGPNKSVRNYIYLNVSMNVGF